MIQGCLLRSIKCFASGKTWSGGRPLIKEASLASSKQTLWANGFTSECHSRKHCFPKKNDTLCREFSLVQRWTQRRRRRARRSKRCCAVTAEARLELRHCAFSSAKKRNNKKISALYFRPLPVSYAVGMAL